MKRVCIFCASSQLVAQQYIDAARRTAQIFVENGWAINYGGGAVGLMGAVADQAVAMGGAIKSIIPQFMVDQHWHNPKVRDMEVTLTMSERKARLVADVDAVVALPGSTGTLDELFEVVSDKKLGLFTKPIVVLNTNGFYDNLKKQLQLMLDEHFMSANHLTVLEFVDAPEQILPVIDEMGETDSALALATAQTK